MAAITATSVLGAPPKTITETTLGASDTLTYKTKSLLLLRNPTGGALTPVIDGDGGTTVLAPGLGSVDVSGGYSVGSVAAGAHVVIALDTIASYLKGTITITGGDAMVACLLEY